MLKSTNRTNILQGHALLLLLLLSSGMRAAALDEPPGQGCWIMNVLHVIVGEAAAVLLVY